MIGPWRLQELMATEIRDVRASQGSQTNQEVTYKLLARLENGGEPTLLTGLPSLRVAESLARSINARLQGT